MRFSTSSLFTSRLPIRNACSSPFKPVNESSSADSAFDGERQLLDEFRQLIVGGIVGRRNDHRVAHSAADVAATWVANQSLLKRASADLEVGPAVRRKRLFGGAIAYEFEADEKTPAPYVANFVVATERFMKRPFQDRAPFQHPRHQRLPLDDSLNCESGRAGRRMTGIGVSRHDPALRLQ